MFAIIAQFFYKSAMYAIWCIFNAIYWIGYTILWTIDLLKYPLHPYVLTSVCIVGAILHYYDHNSIPNKSSMDPMVTTILMINPESLSGYLAYVLLAKSPKVYTKPVCILKSVQPDEITDKIVIIVDIPYTRADIARICEYASHVVVITSYIYEMTPALKTFIKVGKLTFMMASNTTSIYQLLWSHHAQGYHRPEPLMITYMDNYTLPQGKYINEYIYDMISSEQHMLDEALDPKAVERFAQLFTPQYNSTSIQEIADYYSNPDNKRHHVPKGLYDITRIVKEGERSYKIKNMFVNLQPVIYSHLKDKYDKYMVAHIVVLKSMTRVAYDYLNTNHPGPLPIIAVISYYNLYHKKWIHQYKSGINLMTIMDIDIDHHEFITTKINIISDSHTPTIKSVL